MSKQRGSIPDMSDNAVPESPLDPYLVQFLTAIHSLPDGYQPGPETSQVAADLDFPKAFVDALFTSARMRGLLKPQYGRGSKVRWTVSPAGAELVRAT
jgi:hypothetical protein